LTWCSQIAMERENLLELYRKSRESAIPVIRP